MVAAQQNEEPKLVDLMHPHYTAFAQDWQLWRDVYESGRVFVERYLKQYSKREDVLEFTDRRHMTPSPAFAASAIDDVKNSIYQRMLDITRAGGSASYQQAIVGNEGGVDLTGSSMNYFIGQRILPELLVMRRVGVYVDMPPVEGRTVYETSKKGARPYIYMYKAEEICNWVCDCEGNYSRLMLRETYIKYHPKYGVPWMEDTRYRYMYLNADGQCVCEFYNMASEMIDMVGNTTNQSTILNLDRIPFVCLELPHSLLKDAARYQVALLNIGSSDINYILKANFPFYTEQQDWRAFSKHTRGPGSGEQEDEGEAEGAKTGETREVEVGVQSGRAYGQGLDRPGFIHPSPEPLKASMEKQEQLKKDIRQLINLSITNMVPTKQQSVGSKMMDNQGLEAGLSFIGMELEKGERRIAELWAMYENNKTPGTINYPRRYNLKHEDEIRAEVEHLLKIVKRVPSLKFQKAISILIARTTIGYKMSHDDLEAIEKEIQAANFVPGEAKDVEKDVELGILDRANAAKGLVYPDDAVQVANQEHADRLIRIAESQASGQNAQNAAARGIPDLSINAQGGAQEKAASRNQDANPNPGPGVRGAGANNGQNS